MSGRGVQRLKTYDKGAPTGYQAGFGRGAIGFTTRSDIGPARSAAPEVNFGQAPPDKIYQAIDDRMDARRKRSLKYKQRKRQEVFTPAPDHLIESQRAALVDATAPIDPRTGLQTPMSAGGSSSMTGLSQARETVLSIKLDKISDSVSGQTVVDPKGYLTDLNSLKINTDTEVGDIKRARLLLVSLTDTNPKHAPGWVARARVEEQAGKIVAARKIIKEGCEACPESEDVWLEAARLYSAENARTILADAVRHLPQSVKVWLRAADLEPTEAGKKVVLRRALEYLPKSVKLWKTEN
eukprot:evm.model.NODE_1320_length_10197_cov_17.270178.3